MKALSVRQPWAWLIVNGHKDIENRKWPTNYRGPLLILSSKQHADADSDAYAQKLCKRLRIQLPARYDYGGIVGQVTLVNCVDKKPHRNGWFEGPYGFVLADAIPAIFHPYRGKLGLFDIPDNDFPPDLLLPTPTDQ